MAAQTPVWQVPEIIVADGTLASVGMREPRRPEALLDSFAAEPDRQRMYAPYGSEIFPDDASCGVSHQRDQSSIRVWVVVHLGNFLSNVPAQLL